MAVVNKNLANLFQFTSPHLSALGGPTWVIPNSIAHWVNEACKHPHRDKVVASTGDVSNSVLQLFNNLCATRKFHSVRKA